MDLPSLFVALQATLRPNPDEQKATEQSFNQVRVSFGYIGNSVDYNFDWLLLCVDLDSLFDKCFRSTNTC